MPAPTTPRSNVPPTITELTEVPVAASGKPDTAALLGLLKS